MLAVLPNCIPYREPRTDPAFFTGDRPGRRKLGATWHVITSLAFFIRRYIYQLKYLSTDEGDFYFFNNTFVRLYSHETCN